MLFLCGCAVLLFFILVFFFFLKEKTAYEIYQCDWSSDVCSSDLVDVPIMIVHVSNGEAMEEIRRAQQRGLKIYGETCPQYLVLTEKDMEGLNMEGARYVCSPPPRDEKSQKECW